MVSRRFPTLASAAPLPVACPLQTAELRPLTPDLLEQLDPLEEGDENKREDDDR